MLALLLVGRFVSMSMTAQPPDTLDHEAEDIRVLVVPAEEAIEMALQGRVANANGCLPLLWLGLNRARLRAMWST